MKHKETVCQRRHELVIGGAGRESHAGRNEGVEMIEVVGGVGIVCCVERNK